MMTETEVKKRTRTSNILFSVTVIMAFLAMTLNVWMHKLIPAILDFGLLAFACYQWVKFKVGMAKIDGERNMIRQFQRDVFSAEQDYRRIERPIA
jgi:hypothetical protein